MKEIEELEEAKEALLQIGFQIWGEKISISQGVHLTLNLKGKNWKIAIVKPNVGIYEGDLTIYKQVIWEAE